MEEDVAKRIETKLDAIVRLLAAPLVQGKTVTQAVQALAALGLPRRDIATICNTTPAAVSARLSEAKRGQKQTRRRTRTRGDSK